jgi:hypothetical protein
MRHPQTVAEWQEAVDAAAACRMIADCKMYGLIEGGPGIDVARCDEILERGKQKGVRASRPDADLALELIAVINSNAQAQTPTGPTPDTAKGGKEGAR